MRPQFVAAAAIAASSAFAARCLNSSNPCSARTRTMRLAAHLASSSGLLRASASSSGVPPAVAGAAAALGRCWRRWLQSDVDAMNRELADVFGLPSPPDGTCIGPSMSEPPAAQLPPPLPPGGSGSSGGGVGGDLAWPNPDPEPWHTQLMAAAAAPAAQHQQQQLAALQQQLEALQGQLSSMHALLVQLAASGGGGGAPQQQPPPPPPQQQQQQEQHCPPPPEQARLTHVDGSGRAAMVDVSAKPASRRSATASARVLLGPVAFRLVAGDAAAKGDVLGVAQLAGIQAAKATSALIPLCHNIALSRVDVALSLAPAQHAVDIRATAVTVGATGVEMEALTAAAVAGLTVYDMVKAASKGVVLADLRLEAKEGGKSGPWRRDGHGVAEQ